MIAFLALTVGIKPIIPRHKIFVIFESAGRILQAFECLRHYLSFELLSFRLFIPGIVIGLVGLVVVGVAYPLYNRVLKKERERIAPEILRLTDELMK